MQGSTFLRMAAVALAVSALGCGSSDNSSSREVVGADDATFDMPIAPVVDLVNDASAPGDAGAACAAYTSGSLLEATADVNLRAGSSTSAAVLEVVPTGAVVTVTSTGCAVNGFIPVKHAGVSGWSYASYYRAYVAAGSSSVDASPSAGFTRDDAVARASKAVGFAYWWGHGRWRSEGVRPEWVGTCTGSCPSCTFAGTYGADCSGRVAKAWKVPASNSDVSLDSHPFGTTHFVASNSLWSDVSRGALLKADALVYNQNGAGHIMLYEAGDGWGSVTAYECKGCAAGCVRNVRSVSSVYKGIRRAGF